MNTLKHQHLTQLAAAVRALRTPAKARLQLRGPFRQFQPWVEKVNDRAEGRDKP